MKTPFDFITWVLNFSVELQEKCAQKRYEKCCKDFDNAILQLQATLTYREKDLCHFFEIPIRDGLHLCADRVKQINQVPQGVDLFTNYLIVRGSLDGAEGRELNEELMLFPDYCKSFFCWKKAREIRYQDSLNYLSTPKNVS